MRTKPGRFSLIRLCVGLVAFALLFLLGGSGDSRVNGEPLQPIRAIWVQPRSANTPEKADAMLERVVRGGFDTILFGVYPSDVYYRSTLLPRSPYVTSEYDPLAYVVEQGHRRGLKVHAWWSCGAAPQLESFRNRYPDWDIARLSEVPDDTHWLNFSIPEVRQFVGDVVLEIAQNYDVDGVHLDYIRYPSDPSHWRGVFGDDDVPAAVESVYRRLKAVKPNVELTAAVASSQRGSVAHRQNWADWLMGGYIDRVFVMAYVDPDRTYARLDGDWTLALGVKEWQGLPYSERIVPGLKVLLGDRSGAKTPEEFMAQVEVCKAGGFDDIAVFDESAITVEILDALAARSKK
jgi:uncharacterized lipoprotein YddW (UPF0748 family)